TRSAMAEGRVGIWLGRQQIAISLWMKLYKDYKPAISIVNRPVQLSKSNMITRIKLGPMKASLLICTKPIQPHEDCAGTWIRNHPQQALGVMSLRR
ncbi:UNVERIFIED_CONTAM: hypothetical protein Sindi_1483800, partial [Sesamum indicum]